MKKMMKTRSFLLACAIPMLATPALGTVASATGEGVEAVAEVETSQLQYKVTQGANDLGVFPTRNAAIREAVKWANSTIEYDGQIVWNFGDQLYVVYQGTQGLGEFKTLEEAQTEARKWAGSVIKHGGNVAWKFDDLYRVVQGNNRLGSFKSLLEAEVEAKKWANSVIYRGPEVIWSYQLHPGYAVKQGANDIGCFGNLEYAISQAKKWAGSTVSLRGKTVWSFNDQYRVVQGNNRLGTFENLSDAVKEASKWANSEILKGGDVVWKFNPVVSEEPVKEVSVSNVAVVTEDGITTVTADVENAEEGAMATVSITPDEAIDAEALATELGITVEELLALLSQEVEVVDGAVEATFEGLPAGTHLASVKVGEASGQAEFTIEEEVAEVAVSNVAVVTEDGITTVTADVENADGEMATVSIIPETSEEEITGTIEVVQASVLPGMDTVTVTLDVEEPANYKVSGGGRELTYSADSQKFTGVVPSGTTFEELEISSEQEVTSIDQEVEVVDGVVTATFEGLPAGTHLARVTVGEASAEAEFMIEEEEEPVEVVGTLEVVSAGVLPGKDAVRVTLNVEDPENYTVTVKGEELTFGNGVFAGIVDTGATSEDVVVEAKTSEEPGDEEPGDEEPVDVEATLEVVQAGVLPGKDAIRVTLNVEDPENYTVSVKGVELTFGNGMFGGVVNQGSTVEDVVVVAK